MVTPDQISRCIQIARKYRVRTLVLFGSAFNSPEIARDIDLIAAGVTGIDFTSMGVEMEDAVGMQVDLVPMEPRTRFVEYNIKNGKQLYAA